MPTRILIIDDHGVLRAGLRLMLAAQPEFDVVGEAPDGESGLRLALQQKPQVAVVDVRLPDIDGIELARRIKAELPETHIVILTMFEDEAVLRDAMSAGASGYITKRAADSELVHAIRSVMRGDMYVHPAMVRGLVRGILSMPAARHGDMELPSHMPWQADGATPSLTPREREVLRLLAHGYTNRQIADQLHLSHRTVETHRENVQAKLNISSRADLVRYARDHHLL